MSPDTCPGAGQCHGSMKWCPTCGDAAAYLCPHSGCQAHPSHAALCDAVQQAPADVWVAEEEVAPLRQQVNRLRLELAKLEAKLAVREGVLGRRQGDLLEALEDLAGYRRHHPRPNEKIKYEPV